MNDLIPRITVRDHADIHALINALELARVTLVGTTDVVERKDWVLLGELLEAARAIHTDMIVDQVTGLIKSQTEMPDEVARESAQRVAVLMVHPFFD